LNCGFFHSLSFTLGSVGVESPFEGRGGCFLFHCSAPRGCQQRPWPVLRPSFFSLLIRSVCLCSQAFTRIGCLPPHSFLAPFRPGQYFLSFSSASPPPLSFFPEAGKKNLRLLEIHFWYLSVPVTPSVSPPYLRTKGYQNHSFPVPYTGPVGSPFICVTNQALDMPLPPPILLQRQVCFPVDTDS